MRGLFVFVIDGEVLKSSFKSFGRHYNDGSSRAVTVSQVSWLVRFVGDV